MHLRPLLPIIRGGVPWATLNKTFGLNSEQKNDFTNRLYDLRTIDASGVPFLFSHPFVFNIKLSTGDNEAFEKFSTLIKGIFLGIIKLREVTVQLGQLENVARRVKPNFEDFVILEWNNQPIGGIYPDCLVFPGAKFEAGEYGDKFSWKSLRDEIQRMQNHLGSDIVKALYKKWVNEIEVNWEASIKNILGLSQDKSLPPEVQKPLWLQQLSQLENLWATVIQAPATALDDYTTVMYKASALADDKYLVRIPIRSIKKNIFCEKIIKFANEKMPDLPVKSKFLNLIEEVRRNGENYQIKLRGWNGMIEWTPQKVIDGGEASILLWPNFKADNWRINYAFLYSSQKFADLNPSLNLINFNGGIIKKLKEERGVAPGCVTNEEINCIEIFCNEEPLGIFKDEDERESIPSGSGNVRLSLDFGTANTCLGIWDGQNNDILTLEDMSHDILGMGYFDQEKFRARPTWLPTFGGECKVIPSELMFWQGNMDHRNLSRYIECFTIPAYNCAQWLETTVGGFKWHEPPQFSGHRGDLVKAYLKMVLHMALANLRKNHNAQNVDIVATYPLAFDSHRYNDYKKWLEELLIELRDGTGMNIQLEITTPQNKRELVGESYAAKALYRPEPRTAEMVVDIGGGTTDIALWRDDEILAVDSVRYGGDLFLQYLGKHLPSHITNRDIEFVNGDKSVISLQKAIRILGSIGRLFDEYDSAERDNAEIALYKFFDGLFEYLRILLSANELTDNIFLYPIGNGWRLIEGFERDSYIKSFVESWFEGKNISLTVVRTEIRFGLKEDLALGANEIVEQGAYAPPPDFIDNPIRTKMGGKVTIKWNNGRKEFNPEDPIPAVLGCKPNDNPSFSTIDFVKSLPFDPLSGYSPKVIASRLNAECSKEMLGVRGEGVSVIRSVYAKFLETIYPKFYLGL